MSYIIKSLWSYSTNDQIWSSVEIFELFPGKAEINPNLAEPVFCQFPVWFQQKRSNVGKSDRNLNLDIGIEKFIGWFSDANPQSVPSPKL